MMSREIFYVLEIVSIELGTIALALSVTNDLLFSFIFSSMFTVATTLLLIAVTGIRLCYGFLTLGRTAVRPYVDDAP